MPRPIKENVNNGQLIQVFAPRIRTATNDFTVEHGDIIRFSAAGAYEMNDDGVKVPFGAGMVLGVPFGITNIKLYEGTGTTLTPQVIEVM